MNKAIIFWLALLCLFCGGMAIWFGWQYSQRAHARSEGEGTSQAAADAAGKPGELLKEFTLTERSGKEVRSQDLAGEVKVVSFFYSVCPSTCRQENRKIEELVREFGPQGVKFISITCDPDNDTPAKLSDYARDFNAPADQWYFLTGELPYIRRIGGEMYELPVDKQTHSERLTVIDRWGKIRGRYNWANEGQVAEMKRRLSQLLAETAPPVEEPVKIVKPQDLDDDGVIDTPDEGQAR